jgi:hypothetical protein
MARHALRLENAAICRSMERHRILANPPLGSLLGSCGGGSRRTVRRGSSSLTNRAPSIRRLFRRHGTVLAHHPHAAIMQHTKPGVSPCGPCAKRSTPPQSEFGPDRDGRRKLKVLPQGRRASHRCRRASRRVQLRLLLSISGTIPPSYS